MATRYALFFGSVNAGGSPTFSVFRTIYGVAVTPPAIVGDGNGYYHFDYDFSTAPAGFQTIEYVATLNGVEVWDLISGIGPGAPVVTQPSGLVGKYTTDTLLADIRTGAMLPQASTFSLGDTDLLRLADREMVGGIVPLLLSVREEYFLVHTDIPFTPPTTGNTLTFRVPYRAIGGKLRDVCLLSANGAQIRIPQIGIDGLEQGNTGWYMEGNLVTIFSPFGNWQATTIRLTYYQRPNQLVTTGSAAAVSLVNGNQVTLSGAVNGGPVPPSFTSSVLYDLVKAVPSYDSLAVDQSASLVGSVLTFASVPAELLPGDYVCLAQQSPVPQIPPDLHPVLAQRVICKALEALGDSQGLQIAQMKLVEIQQAALPLITPRVDGEPKRIVNRNSPFRRRRRMLLY